MARQRSIKPEAVDVQGTCVTCGEQPQAQRTPGRYHPYCRDCINARYHRGDVGRARWLKRTYDITPEDYQAMLTRQGGVCAICHGNQQHARFGVLCVDHCHTTGKVRGLLCSDCNTAIGLLRDNTAILKSAIEYLS